MFKEDERLQLEKKLETELEDSERQEIEIHICEIYADLDIHKIGILSEVVTELRRSERD